MFTIDIVQCIWKVFRPFDFFHFLLLYSLILKWIVLSECLRILSKWLSLLKGLSLIRVHRRELVCTEASLTG